MEVSGNGSLFQGENQLVSPAEFTHPIQIQVHIKIPSI